MSRTLIHEKARGGNDWKPNLFVAGFAKCGSTALCSYLSQHPDIYVLREEGANTLFDWEIIPKWIFGTNKKKPSLMDDGVHRDLLRENRGYKYRAEESQAYSFKASFAERLKRFSNDAKVLFIIRDQKERAFSAYFYTYFHRRHHERDFNQWLSDCLLPDLQSYLFYDKIVSYYNHFGNNICVLKSSSLKKHPQVTMNKVYEFLGLQTITIRPLVENTNLFSPSDTLLYRRLLELLADIYHSLYGINALGCHKVFRAVSRPLLRLFYSAMLIRKKNSPSSDYSKLVNKIPSEIVNILDEDLRMTRKFCVERAVLAFQREDLPTD